MGVSGLCSDGSGTWGQWFRLLAMGSEWLGSLPGRWASSLGMELLGNATGRRPRPPSHWFLNNYCVTMTVMLSVPFQQCEAHWRLTQAFKLVKDSRPNSSCEWRNVYSELLINYELFQNISTWCNKILKKQESIWRLKTTYEVRMHYWQNDIFLE